MSYYSERATISLHKMISEMDRKGIELARIFKCSTQLLISGISPNSISSNIFTKCLTSQHNDGGWVSIVDTIWNIKFLSFYKNTATHIQNGIKYLNDNKVDLGFGRSKRDIGRIPVTGLAFYLIPEIANEESLYWLEKLWISEKNSLTYKAAYTMMAFKKNNYIPKNSIIIEETMSWLASQQEINGGFAPWKNHPVKANVYCTSVALIGLLQYIDIYPEYENVVRKAYKYICDTQCINGIWPYHELEDGGAWGLVALTQFEKRYIYGR